jgi:hypothetical protein
MNKIILALVVFMLSAPGWAFASACKPETAEPRIIDLITPQDKFFVLTGAQLDRFILNANDLYNIGWVRKDIAKIYVVDAEYRADNPKFQAEHLFFISPEGCIDFYQTTYRALVDLLLAEKPCEVLGLTCAA